MGKDCKDLHKELEFHKVLKSGEYKDKGIDDFVKIRGVPIEVVIKKGGKGDRINHCSKFKFSAEEKKKGGWCATHVTDNEKISGWGMCSSACQPSDGAYSYANMNLLTDEECKNLIKYGLEEGHKDPGVDFSKELCAGKKKHLPKMSVSLVRKKKKKAQIADEK